MWVGVGGAHGDGCGVGLVGGSGQGDTTNHGNDFMARGNCDERKIIASNDLKKQEKVIGRLNTSSRTKRIGRLVQY